MLRPRGKSPSGSRRGRPSPRSVIEGRAIVSTFWGKAWCTNLEGYSDFENRLPRGRTYVRNGSVVDLKIAKGRITALVSGSELYTVQIDIAALPQKAWQVVKARCAGKVGSLVELLQGKLSNAVMEAVTDRAEGLFPKPKEIKMRCSCPDYAGMCKHLAAVMYGIGNRLDSSPELLFELRGVDHRELIEQAIPTAPMRAKHGTPTIETAESGRDLRHRNQRLPDRGTADLENDHEEGPQGREGPGRDEACHGEEGRREENRYGEEGHRHEENHYGEEGGPEENRYGEEGHRHDEEEGGAGFREGVGPENQPVGSGTPQSSPEHGTNSLWLMISTCLSIEDYGVE